MWLCSGKLVKNLRQVSMGDVPVLSTQVKLIQSARDLGINNQCCLYQLKPPHSVALATISLDNCVQLFGH